MGEGKIQMQTVFHFVVQHTVGASKRNYKVSHLANFCYISKADLATLQIHTCLDKLLSAFFYYRYQTFPSQTDWKIRHDA